MSLSLSKFSSSVICSGVRHAAVEPGVSRATPFLDDSMTEFRNLHFFQIVIHLSFLGRVDLVD